MRLADVECFRVSRQVVHKTEQALWHAGRDGYELFVLWSGTIDDSVFTVRTPHVPSQKSYRVRRKELLVRVEGDALHKLNAWLYEAHEILAMQIHAHPTDAYHSETDDSFPIVTELGGVSIVAPDFCRDGLFVDGTAVYRLGRDGWMERESSLVQVV